MVIGILKSEGLFNFIKYFEGDYCVYISSKRKVLKLSKF